MFTAVRTNPSDGEVIVTDTLNAPVSTCITNVIPNSIISSGVGEEDNYLTGHLMGEYTGPVESVLPREFRQRLHKHFARIEREFEREYRRLYSENLALQERLEKFEDGDHSETITLVKKLGASMLSQRIKQQYKQSTSRLVSSLRQSTGHSSSNIGQGCTYSVTQPGITTTTCVGVTSNTLSVAVNSSLNYSGNIALPSGGSTTGHGTAIFAGSFSGHNGNFQLMNRVAGHRDGIWEVTSFRRFIATASADNTARLWINDGQLNCLLVYMGHSGSVNSVRFRNKDSLMLTSSGDGTAHLIRLPFDLITKAATSLTSGNTSGAALDAVASALASETAGTSPMGSGMSTISGTAIKSGIDPVGSYDSDETMNLLVGSTEEDPPVRIAAIPPIAVRHPHAIFQSANLYLSSSGTVWNSTGASGCNVIDSSPLSAADFVYGREQLVTASWDRLGRTYDLATGQELESLTGHDDHLTDVRCEPGGFPVVVTSSRDCTFRLWDFRQPGMRVHVQQAHSQTVSTTQFLAPGSPERLISAGADRFCRIWDLRQSRGPVVSIRTDAAINRLGLSGYGPSVSYQPTETINPAPTVIGSSSSEAPSQAAQHGSVLSTSVHNPCPSSYPKYIALPLVNRGIKLLDVNGNRIGRLTRSSHGHSRMVTCVAWANEGVHNLFSTGFDGLLLAWQIHIGNV
ncbi:Trafficking protein particle complex subunit 1 [Schistosoma haematobium]|uniref:WD repeat-containing protein 37 n=1 Tax=Schistosoma haematobium TaxID=6185 RepID=A0A094ZHE5_SCHHA|nr:Trafficking protein particle complex subunit 1 [Schistosoma haematobium]KAH9584988.1 Trafficking protein particle complex subunit 1 [Schistosoma haematobium]